MAKSHCNQAKVNTNINQMIGSATELSPEKINYLKEIKEINLHYVINATGHLSRLLLTKWI